MSNLEKDILLSIDIEELAKELARIECFPNQSWDHLYKNNYRQVQIDLAWKRSEENTEDYEGYITNGKQYYRNFAKDLITYLRNI